MKVLGRTTHFNTALVEQMLEEFVGSIKGVTHMVAVAADGLLLARTKSLGQDRAESLAAIVAGFAGLATETNNQLEGGGVALIQVEMAIGYLVVMLSADGSRIAALAHVNCDIGQLGYQLQLMVDRVGETALTPEVRSA